MKDSALTELLTPLLAQFGLELEALDVTPAGRRRVLKVTVDGDGPTGRGPSLDDIAEATRAISERLDEADAMGEQAYTLEVSSRGTSRPLTEPKHWRRNTGRLVKVTLDETEPLVGRIVETTDEGAVLEVTRDAKRGTTEREPVPYAEVRKAVIQVEMRKADDLEASPDDTDDTDDADERDDEEN